MIEKREGHTPKAEAFRCARCGERKAWCANWDGILLCTACLRLIVQEWHIRQKEFGELVKS